MDIKKIIDLYMNSSNSSYYSFNEKKYIYINGMEKSLEINGCVNSLDSSLQIKVDNKIIFNQMNVDAKLIANKLKNENVLSSSNDIRHANSSIPSSNEKRSSLQSYVPFQQNNTGITKKIEINRKHSNKPKIIGQ